MLKKVIIVALTMCLSLSFKAMELCQYTQLANPNNSLDHFSQLPNTIRKRIILPLLKNSANCNNAKHTLLSIGLVSKKSYAQINCIFFIKSTVNILLHSLKYPEKFMIGSLIIPGAKHYRQLGNKLYELASKNDSKAATRKAFYSYINNGADPNFYNIFIDRTVLMNTVEKNNFHLTKLLIKHGAQINAINNDGYVAEQSLLYNESLFRSYITKLLNKLDYLQKKKLSPYIIRRKLYKSDYAKSIRNAFKINHLLLSLGAKLHIINECSIDSTITNIEQDTPFTCWVIETITDKHNKFLFSRQ